MIYNKRLFPPTLVKTYNPIDGALTVSLALVVEKSFQGVPRVEVLYLKLPSECIRKHRLLRV